MSDLLFGIMRTIGSGLAAQRRKMEAIASNIANAETTRAEDGLPYRKKTVRVREKTITKTRRARASQPKTSLRTTSPLHIRKALVTAPRKITTDQWIDIIMTAHRLGIRSTATIMYGHVESLEHIVKHFRILREIQSETRGFTEFIPLSFIHWNTPGYLDGRLKAGAAATDDMKMYALSRIMLDGVINNIQVSWVKLGPKMAQLALNAVANDFGGTLMEEHITAAAGIPLTRCLSTQEIRGLIKSMGRIPAQRTTTYNILHVERN